MKNHEKIAEVIKEAGSKLVAVRFIKKDGSERSLVFNPTDFADIKGTGNPTKDPNIFRIRDIKLGQWRSFDARRTLSIKVNGKVTALEQEEV